MTLSEKDFTDLRLSRPVSVTDLWDIDDRIAKLEEVTEKLERIVKMLVTLYHEERVKGWELILREMMNHEDRKKWNQKNFNTE